MKVVKSCCKMCASHCGIDVYVENNQIVKVAGMEEHPFNYLCEQAYAIPELVHSGERLTSPLLRVDGGFRETSWYEALDFIADKLTTVREKYGARAFWAHAGGAFTLSNVQHAVRRFCDVYGTPNCTSNASLCHYARVIANTLTFGTYVQPDYSAATKCIIVWGYNPVESHHLAGSTIFSLLGKGTKLIVVDPVATALARKADIHAQIRPGTDCALALGMLNVIITEGLYDQAFVEQWTVGFDKLSEQIKMSTPKKVEVITGVKADDIINMARIYATNKPASISTGISMDLCTNGIQALRAVATLVAITGNFDIPGGNIYTKPLRLTNFRLLDKLTQGEEIGVDYPLFTKSTREQTAVPLIDQLFTQRPYPIKALFVAGSNPALTWPNSNKFQRGCKNLDLLAVVDIFMTDTVKMADVVLPGTTFLERQELKDYTLRGCNFAMLTQQAIEPTGNSMDESMIWKELANRLGFGEYFHWQDADGMLEYLLKDANITLDQLKQNPNGIYYAQPEFQKYLKDGFNTPSGKVEIYSETMNGLGYEPIPTFHEPAESSISRPDLAKEYPMVLITGVKTRAFIHSQHRNLPSLRKLVPEPLVEINPQTAKSLDIADGDWVTIESLRGSIKIKARLTDDTCPQILVMQHGWSEANANCLTDDEARDPVSAYPGLRSVMCRVVKSKI
ncbi:molybdopterin-dependent oxidoreductase [Chloroflexota bacterium]